MQTVFTDQRVHKQAVFAIIGSELEDERYAGEWTSTGSRQMTAM